MGGGHQQQINYQNLTNFQSTKQIIQSCEEILNDEANDESDKKLWNFRELLTWRLPDHYCSNISKNAASRPKVNNHDGLAFNNQINLYKLDFVT